MSKLVLELRALAGMLRRSAATLQLAANEIERLTTKGKS